MWYLVITIIYWSGSSMVGSVPSAVTLNSKEQCVAAAKKIVAESTFETTGYEKAMKVNAHCIPKVNPRD